MARHREERPEEEREPFTGCELEIMKIIWEADSDLSMQEIRKRAEVKYARNWKRETVSVYLYQLVHKNYLTAERFGRVFTYHPLVAEDEYRRRFFAEQVDFWHWKSYYQFITTFLREQDISPEEKRKIREFVAGEDW